MPYTKEEKREYDKAYRANNKEKILAKKKEHRAENKDKIKEYNQTPKCKKSMTISSWKRQGIIGDLSFIYDNHYLNCKACWVCNHDFSKSRKCCDHDHETGEFRQILCNKCNVKDNWMKYSD